MDSREPHLFGPAAKRRGRRCLGVDSRGAILGLAFVVMLALAATGAYQVTNADAASITNVTIKPSPVRADKKFRITISGVADDVPGDQQTINADTTRARACAVDAMEGLNNPFAMSFKDYFVGLESSGAGFGPYVGPGPFTVRTSLTKASLLNFSTDKWKSVGPVAGTYRVCVWIERYFEETDHGIVIPVDASAELPFKATPRPKHHRRR